MDKQLSTVDENPKYPQETQASITPSEPNQPECSSAAPVEKSTESHCTFDNLLMLDFETTATEGSRDFPYEIIQMGVSVLYGPGPEWTKKPETDFMMYVRPKINPELTDFCTELTGVTQELVDKAEQFPAVFEKFQQWLVNTGIANSNFAIVTDGHQDIWRIAQYTFILYKMPMPLYFKRFISAYLVFCCKIRKSRQRNSKNKRRIKRQQARQEEAANLVKEPEIGDGEEEMEEVEDVGGQKDAGNTEKEKDVLVRIVNEPPVEKLIQIAEQEVPGNLDEVVAESPAKKPKKYSTCTMRQMCKYYGIVRTGKLHNALDDAINLRNVVEKILAEKKTFYFNFVLSCSSARKKKITPLSADWRSDWYSVINVYERVLPLFPKRVYLKTLENSEVCKSCKKSVEECGADGIHMQFPDYLFESEDVTFGPIEFAVIAGLDVQKPKESPSTEDLSVVMAEKL